MRLKTFTAATIAEAMQLVRDTLGPDAVIVTTDKDGDGVRVVAAFDPPEPAPTPAPPRRPSAEWLRDPAAKPPPQPANANPPSGPPAKSAAPGPASPELRQVLAYHGVPEAIVARLTNGQAGPSVEAGLAARMRGAFRFAAIADRGDDKPLLLAGPPGAGKTLAIAKLAARAVMAGEPVRLITTDDSAGAAEQLTAFARPLRLTVETAEGPAGLAAAMAKQPRSSAPLTLIDTQGINPYDEAELTGLAAQIAASGAEPVLVLGAGGDAQDSGDVAEIFAHIGCTHLLVTRIDLARRLGGVLAAAATGLALIGMGASPIMVHGLQPLTPDTLARLFIGNGRSADTHPSEHAS